MYSNIKISQRGIVKYGDIVRWYYKIWKYRNVVLKYSRFCNYHNS